MKDKLALIIAWVAVAIAVGVIFIGVYLNEKEAPCDGGMPRETSDDAGEVDAVMFCGLTEIWS